MRLCTYVVKTDAGLAPNPFWNYCTLALCTPNHMGARLDEGDWIAGFLSKTNGNKLLYAMEVQRIMNFDEYYRDPRFSRKIPNLNGTWKHRCGDNIYFKDENAFWKQHSPVVYHKGMLEKDTKHPNVYISQNFYYFGDKSLHVPDKFTPLVWNRQGIKYHNNELANEFLGWVRSHFKVGIHGEPADKEINCSPTKSTKLKKC